MRDASARLVGIGETPVGKLPGRTSVDLQAEAVRRALADAGLGKDEVDALYTLDPYAQPVVMHSMLLAEYLGISPALAATIDVGGTVSPMTMILNGIDAIERGRAEVVVCVFGENAATGRRPEVRGLPLQSQMGTEEFEDPFGALGMVISYALLGRRYLDLYGLDSDAFAPVALTMRKHAQLNDNAQFRKPMSLEDYLSSPWVAEPLRRLDCCPVSDGAGAIVLTSESNARRSRNGRVPVSVLGFGSQVTHKIVSQMPDVTELGMAKAARQAYEEARLGPSDIDLLTVHDAFTVSVLLSLEAMGFCGEGEGADFASSGAMELGGKLPTNTHGGLLSQGHVGGMLHILEAVCQLRGEAGERQVRGVEVAAVAGNGGVFSNCGVMLLGRE